MFNIVSNDHGCTHKCNFSVFDRKCRFWANLVKKIKTVNVNWNLVLRLIRVCRIQSGCSLFCVRRETPFLGKFGPKNQNCQFKLKFGTKTNSNMQKSLVGLTFFYFDGKHPVWVKLVQKIKTVTLSRNLVPRLIRICRIQRWCSLFLFYTGSILFGKRR